MPLNFPDHTIELTDDLRNKAGILHDFLQFNHCGGHSAIKAQKIIAEIFSESRILDVHIRKMVNYLRQEGMPICACQKGYFWAQSESELDDEIRSLEERETAVRSARNGLKRAREKHFPSIVAKQLEILV